MSWLRKKRLKHLEKYAAEMGKILTEAQVNALENDKEERAAHGENEPPHSGFLFGQDNYYVGYIQRSWEDLPIDWYRRLLQHGLCKTLF